MIIALLLLGNGLLGGLWTKCMFFKKHCSGLSPKSCDLRHYMNTWSATRHKHLVNYMDLAEQRTLGIEPGTSCIRGPILTNWAIHMHFFKNITWYVMTCNMIVETHYGDTHFHREQTHDSKWKIVVLCFSFLKILFMDTLTLDSEFCKVQNKVSIWKFCDSSVYIALGGPDNIIFLILLRLAGNRV